MLPVAGTQPSIRGPFSTDYLFPMKGLPMTEAVIADLFQIQNRFLRSAHLERDFADPKALKGYVSTPEVRDHLER